MSGAGRIKTEQEMVDYLRGLAGRAIATHEQACDIREELNIVTGKIKENPALASNRTLNALTALALNSPHSDIDKGEFHHRQTPQQDSCFHALRALGVIARLQPGNYKAVGELEHIMENSADWDVRHEALMTLWHTGYMKGPLRNNIVAALARQAANNGDMYIRMQARERLLGIAKEHEDALKAALAVLEEGSRHDLKVEARASAYAMLGNAVQTVPGLKGALLAGLKEVFREAASRAGEEKPVLDAAAYGLDLVEKRLAAPGHKAPYPYKGD